MRAVLVLGGDPPTDAELDALGATDLLVATDGGANHLLARGIRPHRIIGDMDSLSPRAARQATADGIPMDRHPRDKSETDGELALRWLLDQGPGSLTLVGGHGGRSAMFLTHLRLLRLAAAAGVSATLEGHGERIEVLLPERTLEVRAPAILDLVAMEPSRVALQGFVFSGNRIALEPWTGQGVSNPVAADRGSVRVQTGCVLAIVTRPGPRT